MPDPDKGDPSVFRTYQGAYSAATVGAPASVTVMRTINNVVCLVGDVEFASPVSVPHTSVMTLPEACRPANAVRLAVGIEVSDGTSHLAELEVAPDGACYLNQKYYLGTGAWEVTAMHTNGACFSIADRWY